MISTNKEVMGTCTYVPSSLDFFNSKTQNNGGKEW